MGKIMPRFAHTQNRRDEVKINGCRRGILIDGEAEKDRDMCERAARGNMKGFARMADGKQRSSRVRGECGGGLGVWAPGSETRRLFKVTELWV